MLDELAVAMKAEGFEQGLHALQVVNDDFCHYLLV